MISTAKKLATTELVLCCLEAELTFHLQQKLLNLLPVFFPET
jgi:hypothetical protein